MKNKVLVLALVSMLVMSGCSAAAETAETDVTVETTEAATEMTTEDDEWVYCPPREYERYSSYEALMNDYKKNRSADNYEYPLPAIVDTWEFKSASKCSSNYTVFYEDTANDVNIMLEISYNSTYEKISDFFDGIAFSMGAENIEMYERYSVQHYTEDDSYSIIGITGEENIRYTLLASSDDETKDPVELLKEYKEILEL